MTPSVKQYLYQTVRWAAHIGTVVATVYLVLLTVKLFNGSDLRGEPIFLKVLFWLVGAAAVIVAAAVLQWTRRLVQRKWFDADE